MSEFLHVPRPHCDTLNRVPRDKLAEGGRCGACHQPLFEGRPLALDAARFLRHIEKSDLPLHGSVALIQVNMTNRHLD